MAWWKSPTSVLAHSRAVIHFTSLHPYSRAPTREWSHLKLSSGTPPTQGRVQAPHHGAPVRALSSNDGSRPPGGRAFQGFRTSTDLPCPGYWRDGDWEGPHLGIQMLLICPEMETSWRGSTKWYLPWQKRASGLTSILFLSQKEPVFIVWVTHPSFQGYSVR